jgi:hypothetical protein
MNVAGADLDHEEDTYRRREGEPGGMERMQIRAA